MHLRKQSLWCCLKYEKATTFWNVNVGESLISQHLSVSPVDEQLPHLVLWGLRNVQCHGGEPHVSCDEGCNDDALIFCWILARPWPWADWYHHSAFFHFHFTSISLSLSDCWMLTESNTTSLWESLGSHPDYWRRRKAQGKGEKMRSRHSTMCTVLRLHLRPSICFFDQ